MPEDNRLLIDGLNLEDYPVEDGYSGPKMEGSDKEGYRITRDFVMAMIEAFRAQKTIHKRFAYEAS